MQDLLAFNCLTWLFVNENPVVNYPVEDIMVNQAWMGHIPVSSCKERRSWFQLTLYLLSGVSGYPESSDAEAKWKAQHSLLGNRDGF